MWGGGGYPLFAIVAFKRTRFKKNLEERKGKKQKKKTMGGEETVFLSPPPSPARCSKMCGKKINNKHSQ